MAKLETNTVKPDVSFVYGEQTYRLISSTDENSLDSKIEEIGNFLNNNNNSESNMDEKVKDELYAKAQEMWREYATILGNSRFSLFLNRKQFNFLTDLILQKLEYDVNTVFIAVELTDLLAPLANVKFANDAEVKVIEVNATELTYIYHLISTFKVKGLQAQAYAFVEVLRKIGDISKIFNYYDTTSKSLSADISNWVIGLDVTTNPEDLKKFLESAQA